MKGERERVATNHQSQFASQQSPKCTLQKHVEFVILYCHKSERRELIRITNHITTKSKMSLQHVEFVILYCHKYERRELIRITNQTKSKMSLQHVELVILFCHKYGRRERERELIQITNHITRMHNVFTTVALVMLHCHKYERKCHYDMLNSLCYIVINMNGNVITTC
jgi:hypothetical protein